MRGAFFDALRIFAAHPRNRSPKLTRSEAAHLRHPSDQASTSIWRSQASSRSTSARRSRNSGLLAPDQLLARLDDFAHRGHNGSIPYETRILFQIRFVDALTRRLFGLGACLVSFALL